jgi:hypothetical protein
MPSVFIDKETPDFRSSVPTNATRLFLELAIIRSPLRPNSKAPLAAPEYLKKSLRLMAGANLLLLPAIL